MSQIVVGYVVTDIQGQLVQKLWDYTKNSLVNVYDTPSEAVDAAKALGRELYVCKLVLSHHIRPVAEEL